ncbi:MAG: restriction endonuclease subunit S, partial [candidate division SR1 bacterium]|nr:restriction endonuclease subunit S [candidate division SR1 bacterium]
GVFQPYSGVKTSILILDRKRAKASDSVLFIKIANDGFDLSAQRRENTKNDLPAALKIIENFEKGIANENLPDNVQIVSKTKLRESGDYNLSGDRYKATADYTNSKYPMVQLGEIFDDLKIGGTPSREKSEYFGEDNLWVSIRDMDGVSTILETKEHIADLGIKNSNCKLIKEGSLLMSFKLSVGKTAFAGKDLYTNEAIIAFEPNEKVNLNYLFYSLSTATKQDSSTNNMGALMLNKEKIKKLKIPLPPLEIQQKIVEEISGYQKIIDGAKQITQNWKPKIDIDPTWEMVKLGDVSKIKGGKRIPKGLNFSSSVTNYPYIRVVDFSENSINLNTLKYIDKKVFDQISNYTISVNDIYVSIAGTIGLVGIIPKILDGKSLTENAAKIVLNDVKILSQKYILEVLQSEIVKEQIKILTQGVGIPKLALERISSLQIPLPPLPIQNEIVARIEHERALVDSSKQLIAIYEAKIKSVIAKVWADVE